MASFTDIIPQFNPYIQQLPVDAMVKVGMEKQKRYDEGVQRIQSQIEQVAGLSVMRPQDKEYLQSKLNELGNNLKGVAAGDFSNFQLVNSVGGMVNQIAKDPFVMAAVKSTAIDQKNIEQMEADVKAGKIAPQNRLNYAIQKRKYMEAGLKDESGNPIVFSGEYIPYTDVLGKLRQIAKDVGVDESIVQNLFNPDGTVNRVMIETVSKGKDANKIYNAFINGLDAADYRQLQIDGVYKYKDADANQIFQTLKTSNDQYSAVALSKKADLETQIADLNSKKSSANPEEVALIDKAILNIKTLIKNIDTNLTDSETALVTAREKLSTGNEDYLDYLKGKIHTDNFLTSMSKSFSEKISHVKYSDNPLWKAIMDENEFAFDKWYKRQQLDIDRRKAAAAEKANKLTEAQLFPSLGFPAPTEGKDVSIPDIVNQEYTNVLNNRNDKLIKLGRWEMKRLGWSDEKISAWTKAQAKARGQSEEEVVMTFGTAAFSRMKSGSVKVPSELTSDVEELENLNNFTSGFKNLIDSADKKAKLEGGAAVTDVADIMKSTKPVEIELSGVGKVKLTPADQLDLARAVAFRREIFSTKEEDRERQLATSRLQNKFGNTFPALFNYGEAQLATNPTWGKRLLTSFRGGFSTITSAVDFFRGEEPGERTPFQKVLSAYTSSSYSNFKDAQEKVYRETFSSYFPKDRSIVLTEKSRPIFDAGLAAMFSSHPEYTNIKTKMDDPKSQIVVSTTPSMTGLSGGSKLTLKVIGKGGESTEPIEITPQQYMALFNQQPEEVNPAFALTRSIINNSPDKSTNGSGLGSIPTSFFGSNKFINLTPELRKRVVGGDFIRDASGADFYYGKIYYMQPGSDDPVRIDLGVPMTFGEAMTFPTMITDNKLKNIISNQ